MEMLKQRTLTGPTAGATVNSANKYATVTSIVS